MLNSSKYVPRVLVVGSINSDLILRVRRLPGAGESLIASEYQSVPGGKGANQAVAAARLGAVSTFVGKTGTDPTGDALITQLRRDGVRTDFVTRCASAPTGLAMVTIDDEGQNSIIVMPGANDRVSEQDVAAALVHDSYDVLLLQLEIPVEAVIATCRLALENQIFVVLDAGPAQQFPLERLPAIRVLTPNETETLALTGIEPASEKAAQAAAEVLLRRCEADAVVLKLGHRGALLYQRNGTHEHLTGHSIQAVDTTAAGDAFTAAMALGLVQRNDLRQAVALGNAAGALAATKLGAQPSLPTIDALEEFLASSPGLSRV